MVHGLLNHQRSNFCFSKLLTIRMPMPMRSCSQNFRWNKSNPLDRLCMLSHKGI